MQNNRFPKKIAPMLLYPVVYSRRGSANQLEPNSRATTTHGALTPPSEGNLPDGQGKCFDAIVIWHSTLRSNFRDVDGLPILVIRPSVKTPLTFVDLSDQPIDCRENTLIATLKELVLRPYNLSTDVMLRASLMRRTQHDHVLLLVLPHITSDGWSMVILCQELMALYDSLLHGQRCPFPDLAIQYADFAVWQREWLQGEVLDRQLSYWRRTLGKCLLSIYPPTGADRHCQAAAMGRNPRSILRMPDRSTERPSANRTSNAVHHFARGVQCAALQVHRSEWHCCRLPDRESSIRGTRRFDRLLCQYTSS